MEIRVRMTRPVYMLSGGITKFAKAHPDKDFRLMVKDAFDAALGDLGGKLAPSNIDGSVISYFSDHLHAAAQSRRDGSGFRRDVPEAEYPHRRRRRNWRALFPSGSAGRGLRTVRCLSGDGL